MHFFPNHMLLAYQTSLLCGHSVLTERFAQYDIVPHKMGLACTHHSWCHSIALASKHSPGD